MKTIPVICDNPDCRFIGDIGVAKPPYNIPPGTICDHCHQPTLREQN